MLGVESRALILVLGDESRALRLQIFAGFGVSLVGPCEFFLRPSESLLFLGSVALVLLVLHLEFIQRPLPLGSRNESLP